MAKQTRHDGYTAVAVLTLHGVPTMTVDERGSVAGWLRNQANVLDGMTPTEAAQWASRRRASYFKRVRKAR